MNGLWLDEKWVTVSFKFILQVKFLDTFSYRSYVVVVTFFFNEVEWAGFKIESYKFRFESVFLGNRIENAPHVSL